MSKLHSYLSKSILARSFVGLTFFISGVFVNTIQGILFITLRHVNINLYRKVNYYLTYTIWCQIVAMTQHWSGTNLTIYYADEESKKLMGTRHTMYLMNHNYEIDWLVAWLCTDQFGILANSKSFAKNSLKIVPIIGWSWIWNEFAFLQRSYEKDLKKIQVALNNFIEHKIPVSFLFFAEGTRLTPSKLEASHKFAKERNLPIFKHHLLPRTKGFNVCVETFNKKYPDMLVCQIELAFPKNSPPTTFMSLVRGIQLQPQLYVRFIRLGDIPSGSEKEMNDYLYELFKEKEELVEYFHKHDEFPGIKTVYKPNKTSLYNWWAWLTAGSVVIPYCITKFLINGTFLSNSIVAGVFLFGALSVYAMVSSTKIQSTGSKYGEATSSSETKKSS